MSDEPCERERLAIDKAFEEWESVINAMSIPASSQQLGPNKEIEPIVISDEIKEITRQVEAMEPLLKKKYLRAIEAYKRCLEKHKKAVIG